MIYFIHFKFGNETDDYIRVYSQKMLYNRLSDMARSQLFSLLEYRSSKDTKYTTYPNNFNNAKFEQFMATAQERRNK